MSENSKARSLVSETWCASWTTRSRKELGRTESCKESFSFVGDHKRKGAFFSMVRTGS